MKHEKTFLLTDLCMWEANKKNSTFYPHAIEVVDVETGAVHFIKSGSRIAFIEGNISARSTQEIYNAQTKETDKDLHRKRKGNSKGEGRKNESTK